MLCPPKADFCFKGEGSELEDVDIFALIFAHYGLGCRADREAVGYYSFRDTARYRTRIASKSEPQSHAATASGGEYSPHDIKETS